MSHHSAGAAVPRLVHAEGNEDAARTDGGAADPLIGQALWRLEDARSRAVEWSARIRNLDWAPAPGLSSAGDPLYHLAAIELDWLGSEVRGDDFPGGWEEWFPVDVRDEQGRLSEVRGETRERHLARLSWVRSGLLATLRVMTVADFREPRVLPAYTVTPEWVLHHLALHEAHHAGQIAFLGHLHRAANS
ncbi:DinB family protein [Deinococcus aerius]|uniref:DinB family protein n=1 Tax=Deinococcus aerius TaxID=200253 RepID=UPI0013FDB7B4|nr:DinB family protein [Deinococcus aerius]